MEVKLSILNPKAENLSATFQHIWIFNVLKNIQVDTYSKISSIISQQFVKNKL